MSEEGRKEGSKKANSYFNEGEELNILFLFYLVYFRTLMLKHTL